MVKAYFKVYSVGSLFAGQQTYIPLSQLFEVLATMKTNRLITEFDVTRATLE
jgi:hypothetical protein